MKTLTTLIIFAFAINFTYAQVSIDWYDFTGGVSIATDANNNVYTVQLKDRYDELLHALGMDAMLNNKVIDLKAPMPGLVLNVLVEEGAEIKKGDNLVVLEAMKMENILKATTDAKVKKIKVAKGNRVEKNEVLIELA